MVPRPPLHASGGVLRRHRLIRSDRLVTNRAVAEALISVAGLVGQPVRNPSGVDVGRVVDVVARWDGAAYPPVTGLVVRVGRRRAFVEVTQVIEIAHRGVRLGSARVNLEDFGRRDGELTLAADVIDHQMVDVEGVRVIRASDLYLAEVVGEYRLVGADVGLQTLARRLGPARWRAKPTPDRVIDWAAIQPFGGPGTIRLRGPNQELKRLHPSDLADLLEELGRRERQELLGALDPETAADALEEMHAAELGSLLREASPEQAAALVAGMEPDEAVDALRDLNEQDRAELLGAMPAEAAQRLSGLLEFPEGTAGGLMTTLMVTVRGSQTVDQVREQLRGHAEHRTDIDAVLVVDDDGALIDDVSLFELLLAGPDRRLDELVGPPWPVVVDAAAPLRDVVDALIENRSRSLVVTDNAGRPIGRILADDVVDALVPDRGRSHFPRLLS